MSQVAKVVILSPLPQLDREFDYSIPEHIENLAFGYRVQVPLGRAKSPVEAVVVGISDSTNFVGELASILKVLSSEALISRELYSAICSLAERSIATKGELIKLAIGSHMVRVQGAELSEYDFAASISDLGSPSSEVSRLERGKSYFKLQDPCITNASISGAVAPAWAIDFLEFASQVYARGESVLVLMPTFREVFQFLHLADKFGFSEHVLELDQESSKSRQALVRRLAVTKAPRIVVGKRGAAWLPVQGLTTVLMFDESNENYRDQASPYLDTVEVVLVRQQFENLRVLFSSHSLSAAMYRFIDIGFVRDISDISYRPKLIVSETDFRIDSSSWKLVRNSLKKGPVLIQVSALGNSVSLFCSACQSRAVCPSCGGPIWKPSSGYPTCRWCSSIQGNLKCSCGSFEFTTGRAGSSRTAAELARMLPGVRVIEATSENQINFLPNEVALIVATPGAEPFVEGGYAAVILLDARNQLSRESLNSTETAIHSWSNAISKGAKNSLISISGIPEKVAKKLVSWNQSALAQEEFASRSELSLPPAVKLASVTADAQLLNVIKMELEVDQNFRVLGPISGRQGDLQKYLLIKYPYSQTQQLVKLIKATLTKIKSGAKKSSSNRSSRAVRINMNDLDII